LSELKKTQQRNSNHANFVFIQEAEEAALREEEEEEEEEDEEEEDEDEEDDEEEEEEEEKDEVDRGGGVSLLPGKEPRTELEKQECQLKEERTLLKK
jgi:hypothetical protein